MHGACGRTHRSGGPRRLSLDSSVAHPASHDNLAWSVVLQHEGRLIRHEHHDPHDGSRRRRSRTLVLFALAFGCIAVSVRLSVQAATPADDPHSVRPPETPAQANGALLPVNAPARHVYPQEPQARADRPFRHAPHDALACTRCHSAQADHGRVSLSVPRDCMACHHTPEQRATCADCHNLAAAPGRVYVTTQTFRIAGLSPQRRQLPFVHEEHGQIACVDCHAESLTLSARVTECASCHREHHNAATDCARCRVVPPEAAHPRTAHVTCAGSGCHTAQAFTEQAHTRTLCLSCHREYADHKPAGNCVDCHAIPPWQVRIP
jgi:hypothetical protein